MQIATPPKAVTLPILAGVVSRETSRWEIGALRYHPLRLLPFVDMSLFSNMSACMHSQLTPLVPSDRGSPPRRRDWTPPRSRGKSRLMDAPPTPGLPLTEESSTQARYCARCFPRKPATLPRGSVPSLSTGMVDHPQGYQGSLAVSSRGLQPRSPAGFPLRERTREDAPPQLGEVDVSRETPAPHS